jgi:hypothetical protein
MGTKNSKIREQKLQKSENKNYKNPGTKKNLGNKITKIWGTKLQKSGNKIQELKLHKFRNKSLKKYGNKNLGTKISKIREQKLQNSGTKIT